MNKAETLAAFEGYHSPLDLCESLMGKCTVPGICSNENCNYTVNMEPDQGGGYCEICGSNTVVSIFILEGII